ncbi:MAG: leucyl/phenylalanyl-tRNA--protein transferase [Desulfococcus sp.]|nr:MAG: leucyl/phenylalanyl-tRNA--protein transferase [Desulfococcus sp.]
MPVFRLGEQPAFPPPHLADASGLLAVGGDLRPERLLAAYRAGIFPWYGEEEPLLWWSPDPRMVIFPDRLHTPRSLKKILRQNRFTITFDTAFDRVIENCAGVRHQNGEGTWIMPEMICAYQQLHRLGIAHSAEAWRKGRLAGGLYGVSLGSLFFGESMFMTEPDASKAAFITLAAALFQNEFTLIDCQIETAHLSRFGGINISRKRYLKLLARGLQANTRHGVWDISDFSAGHYRNESPFRHKFPPKTATAFNMLRKTNA